MNTEIFYIIPNTIGVLFNIIFLFFAIKKYKHKTYKERVKPLKFLAILLIVLEILKIFLSIAKDNSYTPAKYPIIYCSFIMYAYPIICSCDENCIASRISKGVSAITGLVIGGAYLIFFPDENYTIDLFYHNLHSRFYHFGMLAGAIYIIAVDLYDFKFNDFYASGLTVSAYMLFCTILSIFLGGDISYFGPQKSPLRFIYNKFGYCVGNMFIIILVMLLSFSSYYIANILKKFKKNK